MKVVALISGGKDSTFNMMECVKRGHEIICLLNMYPTAKHELDSYMYQSVGHEAIEEYAKCLQLPLIRRPILGTPRNLNFEYSAEDARDEVEDLYAALKEVKAIYPDVEGVSSGAIWSSYQKNRVEHICDRLRLTSLAFLWQRDQTELLQDMIDANLEAALIKVAVYGLGKQDLGLRLRDVQPKLMQLKKSYGINVCGEGGEFESMTLDCPLFRTERLELLECETIMHKDDPFAPVFYLKINKIQRVPK